jgi:tetratricopeptide (TPR) repeat protein
VAFSWNTSQTLALTADSRADRIRRWLDTHRHQVLLGLTVVLVGGGMIAAIAFSLVGLRARVLDQFAAARSQAMAGKNVEALEALNKLLESQKTGVIAVQALLTKGDLLTAQGRYDDAVAAFEQALRQADRPAYRALAVANIAQAREDGGKLQEAETLYQQFLKDFPDHFLTARMYLALGRVQQMQGKAAEGRATWERLVTLYPATTWGQLAQARLGGTTASEKK